MLYFFLVFPFIGFIIFQNVPTFMENRGGGTEQIAATADSLRTAFDSIAEFSEEEIDSLVNLAIQGGVDNLITKVEQLETQRADTLSESADDKILIGPHSDDHHGLKMFEESPEKTIFILVIILLVPFKF